MTNEDKAREILGCNFWIDNVGTQTDTLARYIDLNKMAEWKDEYFKKVLEDKLSFFEEEYKKSHSEYMSGVCDGIRSVWNILFNNNEEK